MSLTSCPNPGQINPLRVNGFRFDISKVPELTYFVSRCEIPSITLDGVSRSSRLSDSKYPGDKISYGKMLVEFQVDEEMKNWNIIYFWLTGMGFPEDNEQYEKWLVMDRNRGGYQKNEMSRNFSDATLTPLNAAMNPIQSIRLVDVFPTSLSGASFDAGSTTNDTVKATAEFEFSYMHLERPWPL